MTESAAAVAADGYRESAGPSPSRTSRVRDVLWIVGVATLLLGVAFVVHDTATQRVAPYVPLWSDQVQYLTEAYRGHDLIRAHGPIVGTIEAVRQPRPQGWLLQTVASLYMQIVGAGRVAALDLNVMALMLVLAVTAYAVKRAFGISASLVALGLLLSTAAILNNPGGPFDFRLDYAAMCLWGSLVALVAACNDRPSRAMQVAIFLLGAALIVTRFISVFYLAPFGALVAVASVLSHWRSETSWRRWWSWMVPIVVTWVIVAAVIISLNFEVFASYYIRGHVTGEEVTVRRLAGGLVTAWDDAVFYPRVVSRSLLPSTFYYAAGAVLLLSVVVGLLSWRASAARRPSGWFVSVSLLALLAAYTTLSVAQQKSGVVGTTFVPPIVLLIVGVAQAISRSSWDEHRRLPVRLGLLALGPVLIVVGLQYQLNRIEPMPPGLPPRDVLQTYAAMIDDIVPYAVEAGGSQVVLSLDGHYAELSYPTIQLVVYERSGQWVNLVGGKIGYGALEHRYTEAELLEAARASDILVLATYPPGARRAYPDEQSVQDQHEVLDRYAQAEMTLLGTYQLGGVPFHTYVRPRRRVRAPSDASRTPGRHPSYNAWRM